MPDNGPDKPMIVTATMISIWAGERLTAPMMPRPPPVWLPGQAQARPDRNDKVHVVAGTIPQPVRLKAGKEEDVMNKRGRGARGVMSAVLISLLLGITVIAGTLFGGQPAIAGGSPPAEVSFTVDLPANFFKQGACAFPVRLAASGKGGTIDLPGDRFIFTSPGLMAVVTNLDDPSKSVNLTVTGAFHQSIEPNGDVVTIVTGRNLLGDPEAGFVLAIGTFSFTFDAAGALVQPLAGFGQLVNVCEMID